jgi:hypothetical protein
LQPWTVAYDRLRVRGEFFRHEPEFEALLAEVQADADLTMIRSHEVTYSGRTLPSDNFAEIERLGLTKERWAMYQGQLRELGLVQINKANGSVEFRVDQGSYSNGDSYKGFEYESGPPEHSKVSLDGYRISEEDRDKFGNYYATRPLKGPWRLYLFVNG